MNLVVKRTVFTPHSTIGEMWVDNNFMCYTLEDAVRGPGVKLPGVTAIPIGEYEVIIDHSNRFNKDMPHILNVPNFEGIRIHCGNTDKDTEGCILLGMVAGVDTIGHSRTAFEEFFAMLKTGLEQGKVYITVA